MADIEAHAATDEDSADDATVLLGRHSQVFLRASSTRWRLAIVSAASLVVAGFAAWSHSYARSDATRSRLHSPTGLFSAPQGASEYTSAKLTGLLPRETKGDNNTCADDEEEHLGLCYDKCASLTSGQYPFRQSAWTCCKSASCGQNPFQMFSCCKHNMGWCSGFDIAGMMEGQKICPHKPGACLVDEELFLGLCYKSCSLLTESQYPYRVAPATCCMRKDASCMIEKGVKDGLTGESITNSDFDVGGGCDDGQSLTKCEPHPPQTELTE